MMNGIKKNSTLEKIMAKSKKFPQLTFHVSQLPGCCGIGVVHNFEDAEPQYDWRTGKQKRLERPFKTKEEQAEGCYKGLLEATCYPRDHYAQLLIALVSNYEGIKNEAKQVQRPELQDLLIREGWTIHSVFINPNHGNEVTLFGKYFPERHEVPEEEDDF